MEKNKQNEERSTEKPKKSLKTMKAIRIKQEVSTSLTDVQKVSGQTKGDTVENSNYLKVPSVELPKSIQGTKTRRPGAPIMEKKEQNEEKITEKKPLKRMKATYIKEEVFASLTEAQIAFEKAQSKTVDKVDKADQQSIQAITSNAAQQAKDAVAEKAQEKSSPQVSKHTERV